LAEMLHWAISPDELRIPREVLCWLHELMGVREVVGFPDLSSPHALPFTHRRKIHRPTRKR
jgi:hypothetical protein